MQHKLKKLNHSSILSLIAEEVEKDVGAELYAKLREKLSNQLESQLIRLMNHGNEAPIDTGESQQDMY